VNVTAVPAQTLLLLANIVTEGICCGFTVTGIALLVTLAGDAQSAFDVISTDTWSLLVSELVVNVAAVAPETGLPLILH
jgi:hypothetical protein